MGERALAMEIFALKRKIDELEERIRKLEAAGDDMLWLAERIAEYPNNIECLNAWRKLRDASEGT
jgi:hypothetical protein